MLINAKGARLAVITATATLCSSLAQAGMLDNFKDPDDGWIDGSNYLLEKQGSFLPVPIIITEPAVENGLGLAGVFFHKRPESETRAGDKFAKPSVSAVAAGYTGNDSWFVGGGHLGIWRKDTVRYTGVLGYGSVNLEYYGAGNGERGLKFNGEGAFSDQRIQFRLADSEWLLGATWEYSKVQIKFDLGLDPDLPIDLPELDFTNSAIGPNIEYDSRDSTFTPNTGQHFQFEALVYDEAIGGDFDYIEYEGKYNFFAKISKKWVIGTRLDVDFIDGDAPFFAQPFIDMRGIPAMRYQGNAVVEAEVELRWDFHPRISALGFVGAGKAADSASDLSSASTESAYGLGIRYLLANKLGLRAGLDVAKGPEDTTVYLTIGQAWN